MLGRATRCARPSSKHEPVGDPTGVRRCRIDCGVHELPREVVMRAWSWILGCLALFLWGCTGDMGESAEDVLETEGDGTLEECGPIDIVGPCNTLCASLNGARPVLFILRREALSGRECKHEARRDHRAALNPFSFVSLARSRASKFSRNLASDQAAQRLPAMAHRTTCPRRARSPASARGRSAAGTTDVSWRCT